MSKSKKKFIITIIITCAIIAFGYWLAFMPHYKYGSTSPDGAFRVDVYLEPKAWATAPGDGGSGGSCILILRNRWGFQISRSMVATNYGLAYCDEKSATFNWSEEEHRVWYVCDDRISAGFNLQNNDFLE